MRFVEHVARIVEGAELRVHADEFGGEEGILVEAVVDEVLVDDRSTGAGVSVGAGEDEGFVGSLGGFGFLGEKLEGLFEIAFLA